MAMVTDEKLKDLAQVYNQEGKRYLYGILREEYGIKNPYFVLQRMKNRSDLEYNEVEDHFQLDAQTANPDDVFLSMDELCAVAVTPEPAVSAIRKESRPDAMEKLVRDLIGDRLLELSRYVKLDTLSRALIIDQTSLVSDGYQVIIH